MGKVNAVIYRFDECQCEDVMGRIVDIEAGIYPVAELDAITVAIGNRTLDLKRTAFMKLKADGKVRPA